MFRTRTPMYTRAQLDAILNRATDEWVEKRQMIRLDEQIREIRELDRKIKLFRRRVVYGVMIVTIVAIALILK